MKRLLLLCIFTVLLSSESFATHQRAAEITYEHVGGLTFKFLIITYTYTPSPADRPSLEIFWGDSTSSVVPRTLKVNLPNDISRNEYETYHTYPGPAKYMIYFEDPNRNYGVMNIPNSV